MNNATWGTLRLPALRRLLGAYGVSKVGDMLYNTSLVVVVLQRTHSATWVSAALIAQLLPYTLLTPLAGVLADRVDRRRLMIATDLLRALLMLVAAVVIATGAPTAALIAVALGSASVGTPFFSALMAMLPEVVEEDRLPAANAAIQVLLSAGVLGGPALAALVLGRGTAWLPFALNALTFVVSALLLTGVRRPAPPVSLASDEADTDAGDQPPEAFAQALLTGVRSVLSEPTLRLVVLLVIPALTAFGMEEVWMPLVSRDLLGTGEPGLGWLTAATGVGGILGAGLAVRAAGAERLVGVVAIAALGNVLPMAFLSVVTVPAVAYAVLLIEGASATALEVVLMTAIQRSLPLDQVARVDGLITSVAIGAGVIGNVAAPLILDALGLRAALLVAGVSAAAVALAVLAVAGGRRVPPTAPALAAVLRRIPALDGLDESGYEALAKAAEPAKVLSAGQPLLTAGGPADHVLVLVAGSGDVLAGTRDGAPLAIPTLVNQVRAPELLGEIGVLQRRPRTAGVVATTDCTVHRIPAGAFEAVLTPGASLPLALGIAVTARLGRWPG